MECDTERLRIGKLGPTLFSVSVFSYRVVALIVIVLTMSDFEAAAHSPARTTLKFSVCRPTSRKTDVSSSL